VSWELIPNFHDAVGEKTLTNNLNIVVKTVCTDDRLQYMRRLTQYKNNKDDQLQQDRLLQIITVLLR